jgi:putative sigma-54 modulation protein
MKVEYTGRHTEVPREIRALADRKLRKLARVLPGITSAHVILVRDRHLQAVEVIVHSRQLELRAVEKAADFGVSLGLVMDKLVRQAQRHLGKLRPRKGSATLRRERAATGPPPPETGDGGPRVIRARRFVAKPMTVEEAALRMGTSEYGFLVFRDAETERVNVLYKRSDGNLGLIEPEA